jgi:DNA-binding NarL/FixJ family response regulator
MLSRYLQGLSDETIARELEVSARTVRRRFVGIRRRLGARTRAEAVALLVHAGAFDPTQR